jgi:hypothetical protein
MSCYMFTLQQGVTSVAYAWSKNDNKQGHVTAERQL